MRQAIRREKHGIQELIQYRENMIKKNPIKSSYRVIIVFLFSTTGSSLTLFALKKPIFYVKGTTPVHIAVVANSGFLKLEGTNSNATGGQRIVHLLQGKCLQFSPQRTLQCLI